MLIDQLKAVWERIATWPEERQRQLAEVIIAIEAEIAVAYQASADELKAIDTALKGDAAKEEDVKTAYDTFRRHEG